MPFLAEEAEAVIEAAVAYIDSDEPTETKDLLFELEHVVERYKAALAAPAPSYRCQGCKEPIVHGERCAACGRGWFVEKLP